MKLIPLFAIAALAVHQAAAFTVLGRFTPSSSTTRLSSSTTDIEALLAKARQLKAEAAAAEQELHKEQLEKKQCKDSELDEFIDKLFPPNDDGLAGVSQDSRKVTGPQTVSWP
ncbi:expressed unknown protein [Seminavis robusta]|uniref:Uncharacterized protein n=1 Tax=Seminavis robusta TaxID=568900 RepID=A0A9N8EZ62_9STRA|nr:expressed unknown protein [Seminavis robusta]|eukprot:Sro2618_g332810.1 n/a (113) ;mRNA; f:12316-12654